MWPITLSGRLPIVDLVGRYLTNYLMGREAHPKPIILLPQNHVIPWSYAVLVHLSVCYSPCLGKVAHALLTRPPLKQFIASYSLSPLDLHVLGTPPAFVLSQDQTLSFNPLSLNQVSPTKFHSFGITVLFALLLFCIVFKVRTSLPSAFEAARATSFVSILLFRPPVKGFWEGFCGFLRSFGISER